MYREMGKTGEKVSILGFGCMHLPTDRKDRHINRKEASALLDFAIDSGVNYLDTAYPYHGVGDIRGGDSEIFLGEYLSENSRRDDVYISTKLPVWLVQKREDMDAFLDLQLKRLKTDHIDFYLLHSVKERNWSLMEDLGVLDFLDSAVADGRIKYTGFSSHDETELFKDVTDTYNWDMCLIQHNYLDEDIQAGRDGLEFAVERDMGVAVMEPLKGGVLASHVPPEVSDIWSKSPVKRTPAEWAFRYLWNNPNITTVLSGMNSMKHLVENVFTALDGEPNSLSTLELGLMDAVKEVYHEKIAVNCNLCDYCMPCPNGVNIPQCFSYLNQASMLEDPHEVRIQYGFMLTDEEKADMCTGCGVCEELCTQKIPVRDKLKQVKEEFR